MDLTQSFIRPENWESGAGVLYLGSFLRTSLITVIFPFGRGGALFGPKNRNSQGGYVMGGGALFGEGALFGRRVERGGGYSLCLVGANKGPKPT